MTHSDSPPPSLLKVFAGVCTFFAVLIAILWFVSGTRAVEKLVTNLAMPVGIIWVSIFVIGIMAFQRRQKAIAFFLAVVWLLFSLAGNGTVSSQLMAQLESEYVSIKPTEMEPFDAIVVLGGGTSMAANNEPRTNGSGGRIVVAAQMYHQGLTKKIICGGGKIKSLTREELGAGAQAIWVLSKLGVPEDTIQLIDSGENTTSELKAVADVLEPGTTRLGMLSSAWHLPRCMRIARNNGLKVIPIPADFRSSPTYDKPPLFGEVVVGLIPKGEGLDKAASAIKEYLARLVGR